MTASFFDLATRLGEASRGRETTRRFDDHRQAPGARWLPAAPADQGATVLSAGRGARFHRGAPRSARLLTQAACPALPSHGARPKATRRERKRTSLLKPPNRDYRAISCNGSQREVVVRTFLLVTSVSGLIAGCAPGAYKQAQNDVQYAQAKITDLASQEADRLNTDLASYARTADCGGELFAKVKKDAVDAASWPDSNDQFVSNVSFEVQTNGRQRSEHLGRRSNRERL